MAHSKAQIMEMVQQEAATANARNLVNAINKQCFKRCVQKPANSLSSSEQSCYTMCMEKYMGAWNVVSRVYVSRLQQEQQQRAMLGGGMSFDSSS